MEQEDFVGPCDPLPAMLARWLFRPLWVSLSSRKIPNDIRGLSYTRICSVCVCTSCPTPPPPDAGSCSVNGHVYGCVCGTFPVLAGELVAH